MAQPENPQALLDQTLTSTLARVRDAGVLGVSNAARRIENLRRSQGLATVEGFPYGEAVSDFNLAYAFRSGDMLFNVPVITMNPTYLLGRNANAVTADIVKTIAIADQFPFTAAQREYARQNPSFGYQRRLAVVYDEALTAQEQWLETNDADLPTRLDPRKTDRDEVIKNLLGYGRYYADIGFTDFLAGVEKAEEMGAYPQSFLDTMKSDPLFFLLLRKKVVHSVYANAKEIHGEETFNDFSADKRAELCAPLYLQQAFEYQQVPTLQN
jgi:hypothetical protein